MNLRKNLEIHPNPIVEVGSPVSRVEMNAKSAPLTPASPHRRLSTAIFTAKGRKNCLDKADAVIHGQCLPIFHSDGLEFAYFGQDLCESVCEPIKVITLVS